MPKLTAKSDFMLADAYIDFTHAKFPNLVDAETGRALFALRIIARRVHDRMNAWLLPFRLTVTKFRYLAYLYAAEGESYTLNELSELLGTSNASVTEIVNLLRKDRLVECRDNPDDRRSLIVHLTRQGTTLLKKAYPVYQENVARAMAPLTRAESKTFLALLLKVGRGFESVALPPVRAARKKRSP